MIYIHFHSRSFTGDKIEADLDLLKLSSMMFHHSSLTCLRADEFLVLINGTIKLMYSPLVAEPEARANILQHCHVVRYHEDTSLEVPQRI